MKIVIDDKIPFIEGILEPYANVLYVPGNEICREHVKDADALIIRTRTFCNEALLEGTNVKFIATATIGYDHIDTAYCEANGILWKNAAGCNSGSVMQYVASVLVHLSEKYGFAFSDRCLGVVGVGNVGKKVVRLGEALGMRVVLCDPPVARRGACGYISLNGLLREADIVSLHVPLTFDGPDATFHLFGNENIQKINRGSVFINSSRGETVETASLLSHISRGYLQATVLDVWENEPDIDLGLLAATEIATPHIAGYSADGKARGTVMAVNAISSFFHLGLNSWYPAHVPPPMEPVIEIDCSKLNLQQAICKAIKHTYNVNDDNTRLRKNPATFELQRGSYPLRREFHAYTIHLLNDTGKIAECFKMLGFQLVNVG